MKKVFAVLAVVLLLVAVLQRISTGRVDSPLPVVGSETKNGAHEVTHPALRAAVTKERTGHAQRDQSLHATLLATIESQTDPDLRSEALDHAVESVSHAELPALLESLVPLDTPAANELRELLIRRWAENDAPASAAWAAQLPEGPTRRGALEQTAIAWANTDLAAAVDWLPTLPDGESKQAATFAVAYEAARTEPLSAIELVCALPSSSERDELLVHTVNQWAVTDFTTAADWAKKISDSDLQQKLLASVAVASAEQDAVSAAALVADDVNAGETQDRAAVAIVQRWAQQSPQDAASWVKGFPEGPALEAALQNLAQLDATRSEE